jgi:hypothetical protein
MPGGLVFACGGLIMIGSAAMTKLHRLSESAILETPGDRRKVLVLFGIIATTALARLRLGPTRGSASLDGKLDNAALTRGRP